MTAAQLCPILRNAGAGLVLAGLMVAEFLGLRAAGMLASLAGIALFGAWACAAYLHWEHGE